MVDLMELVARKGKYDAAGRMQELQLRIATNNRAMEDSDYKTLVHDMTKQMGVKEEVGGFNRDKFEQLRTMMN
jgi:hypothetical protein